VRDNPVLDRLVSEMLYHEHSFREIEKAIASKYDMKVSRETIRVFHDEIYLPRISDTSPVEKNAWKEMMESNDNIVKAVVVDRMANVLKQATILDKFEKEYDAYVATIKSPMHARDFNILGRRLDALFKAQDAVAASYEKAFSEQQRVDAFKKCILEAIKPTFNSHKCLTESDKDALIKHIAFVIRPITI